MKSMTTVEFLSHLRGLGAKVQKIDKDRLNIKAPEGSLSDEIKSEISARKDDILAFLNQAHSGGDSSQNAIAPSQTYNWVRHRITGGAPSNHVADAYEIKGDIVVSRLQESLSETIKHFDIFKSHFVSSAGVVRQVHSEEAVFEWLHLDLQKLASGESIENALNTRIREACARPFEPSRGNLLRCMLFSLNDQQHIFLLAAHRLIADHITLSLLAGRSFTIYDAKGKGVTAQVPQPSLKYNEYALQQRQALHDDPIKNKIAYWVDQLDRVSKPFELPGDYPRPNERQYNSESQTFNLSHVESQQLNELVGSQQCSVEDVLLSAWVGFLSRYVYTNDIVVNIPVDLRTEATTDLPGNFEELAPIRVEVSENYDFKELIKATHQVRTEALENSFSPFFMVTDELQLDRHSEQNPFSQLTFTWENNPEAPDSSEITISRHACDFGLINADMELRMSRHGDQISGALIYDTELYHSDSIARILKHFQTLLGGMLANPARSVSEFDILGEDEARRLLDKWNPPIKPSDHDGGVPELLQKAFADHSDRSALVFAGQTMSYGELEQASNRLANFLIQNGVSAGSNVAVLMPRSLQRISAVLAILKSGAAYVPIDPKYPVKRKTHMLEKARCGFVLTEGDAGQDLTSDLKVISIDGDQAAIAASADTAPDIKIKPDASAVVHFVSSAKQSPQAIFYSHANICNRLSWLQGSQNLSDQDRFLQTNSYSNHAFIWELFWPLSVGASVVLSGVGEVFDTRKLTQIIDREKITAIHLWPTILNDLLDETASKTCQSLQYVFCSGEALKLSTEKAFFSRFRNAALFNFYGPAELTGQATAEACQSDEIWDGVVGKPIANTHVYILDSQLRPLPVGVIGDLYLGGSGMVDLGVEDSDRFIDHPYHSGEKLYRSGDLARRLRDGRVQHVGRSDHQMKLFGYRIEPEEIQSLLQEHELIEEAQVLPRRDMWGKKRLIAYYNSHHNGAVDNDILKAHLAQTLPSEMIPDAFVRLSDFPLNAKGEVDWRTLPTPREFISEQITFPRTYSEVERQISKVWKEVLGLEKVGIREDFFDLGGNAHMMVKVFDRLPEALREVISLKDLFRHRTIYDLDLYLEKWEEEHSQAISSTEQEEKINRLLADAEHSSGLKVAIVGMACRLPGANDPETLWKNVRNSVESITFFTDEELIAEGVDPERLQDPDFVKAQAVIDDVKGFDAGFFGLTPREAQITDPQQRLFIECAWEAMEHAGYAPDKFPGKVGVFGGIGSNQYYAHHLLPNKRLWETIGNLPLVIGNDTYNVSGRVAYKFGFTGPAMEVSTACSSSIVAVHLASRALLEGECDMAMAGAVFLGLVNKEGYLYEEGMLYSPDGHCRAFDADAKGSVPGQGAATLLLKRLDDAIRDGDQIYAVVKGTAMNNDGQRKDGYTTYSAEGQAECIMQAHKSAGVSATEIDYVETSSTASKIGDPIEVNGLTQAFHDVDKKNFCALGALKPNIGGVDTASGLAAMIKTAMALRNQEMPPVLHFKKPHPNITLEGSPFFVNNSLREWRAESKRRLAGVSAFGLGGFNAHVVLEEGIRWETSKRSRPWQILKLSAKTASALETMTDNLITHIRKNPDLDFSDVAYTLQVGRQDFNHRRMLVCHNLRDAVTELSRRDPERVYTRVREGENSTVFMFPGQGAQYLNMGRQLYQLEPSYRKTVDHCWDIISELAPDLFQNLSDRDRGARTEKVHQTYVTQPATFVVEYALARTLMEWGIQPRAMIGNSLGEYVAACLAGVFSLKDALKLVITRGRLMQSLPPGRQLSVNLSEDEVKPLLNDKLSIAGVAGPHQTMVSGDKDAIKGPKMQLDRKGVTCNRLYTSHAFHSYMMEPIMEPFIEAIREVTLNAPQIPFISTITGDWIKDEEVTSPEYWARQFRDPVRFSQGLELLFQQQEQSIFLEVGPKRLSNIAFQHPAKGRDHLVLASMREPQEEESDVHCLLRTLGRLWLAGIDVDWSAHQNASRRHRLPLPTYPFEKQKHWIDAPKKQQVDPDFDLEPDTMVVTEVEGDDDFYRPNVSTGYEAPRNQEEQVIASAWSKYLGLDQIGIHDDFFELGGSSLIAVRLLSELSKAFNMPIGTHVLLQKKTVATLAEFIAESASQPAQDNKPTALVEIQRGNPKITPIFMVHPIGGEVYFFKDFAHNLGPNQPIYGFQARSLTGEIQPYSDLVKQASDYIDDLLDVKPKGPFILGGASYGGVVAYEMAQQLVAKGHKVPLIIIIDSPAPGAMPVKQKDSASILSYLLGDRMPLPVEEMRELTTEEQMSYVLEVLRISDQTDSLPVTLTDSLFNTWLAHQDAMFDYQPSNYDGRVLFFRHTERIETFPPNPHIPWIDLVKGGIEIHQTPGDHISMNFNPNAKALAKHVRRALKSL